MSDKSGTSAGVIFLPQGGSVLQGIGEIFSPCLFTGTGNFTVLIALPPGLQWFPAPVESGLRHRQRQWQWILWLGLGPQHPRCQSQDVQRRAPLPRRIRQSNQDRYPLDLEAGLFVVADDMGGHQAGEVASQVVVTVLPRMIYERGAALRVARRRVVELTLREAILRLSQWLRAVSAGRPGLTGMGAIVTLAWLPGAEGIAYLAQMGDSRSYLLRGNRLVQLTEDHSIVALLLKRGESTPDQVSVHPARGELSRYVGIEGDVHPDVQTLSLRPGDRQLLCTDGLTSMVPHGQIAARLRTSPNPTVPARSW